MQVPANTSDCDANVTADAPPTATPVIASPCLHEPNRAVDGDAASPAFTKLPLVKITAGLPPLGAIDGTSPGANHVPCVPLPGSTESISLAPATNSRGPSARNETVVAKPGVRHRRRVTLIDP